MQVGHLAGEELGVRPAQANPLDIHNYFACSRNGRKNLLH
jgi:hypothetical protein